jgi:hypothetical protein
MGLSGVFIAAVLMLLAIGAAVFAPLNYRLGVSERQVSVLSSNQREHEQILMHPQGLERVEGLTRVLTLQNLASVKALESLDAKLQVETRLLNDTISQRIQGIDTQLKDLDTRLQREFILANDNTIKTATALEKSFGIRHDDLRESLILLRSDSRERLAAFEVRLNTLETKKP